jgi:predicted GNAT superfamily acetyltransferase
MTSIDVAARPRPVDSAEAAALGAAAAARVTLRELRRLDEHHAAVELLAEIWGRPENPPIAPELLRAFAKSGGYIAGAFEAEKLVGVTVGFHAAPELRALHSHIAGILPSVSGRSIGYAMKLHQRAWAVARGIPTIEWTFDPLVARNAYFNIQKLAAMPVEYLTNFYGIMGDGINGEDETDRLLIKWRLLEDDVTTAAALGRAARVDPHGPGCVRIAVPADIETLRREDPAEARKWRSRVRTELGSALADGGRIVGFDRTEGYIVKTEETA